MDVDERMEDMNLVVMTEAILRNRTTGEMHYTNCVMKLNVFHSFTAFIEKNPQDHNNLPLEILHSFCNAHDFSIFLLCTLLVGC